MTSKGFDQTALCTDWYEALTIAHTALLESHVATHLYSVEYARCKILLMTAFTVNTQSLATGWQVGTRSEVFSGLLYLFKQN